MAKIRTLTPKVRVRVTSDASMYPVILGVRVEGCQPVLVPGCFAKFVDSGSKQLHPRFQPRKLNISQVIDIPSQWDANIEACIVR